MLRFRTPLLLTFLLAGCCTTQPTRTPCPAPATAPATSSGDQVATLLFFGLGRNDGGMISGADFDAFAAREIAPRFPDGYTILHGDGHWREKEHDYSEPSRILLIIHPVTPEAEARIEQLRVIYCRQFRQTSVLRMDQPASKVLF